MSVRITDNSAAFLSEMQRKKGVVLEKIGELSETYAKMLCPVGTPESTGIKGYRGGTLRDSITHDVDGDEMLLGSNVKYAPYVELGTGPHFVPPPEWEQFTTTRGSGVGHSYVRARPYIRPAIEEHRDEYKDLTEHEMRGG